MPSAPFILLFARVISPQPSLSFFLTARLKHTRCYIGCNQKLPLTVLGLQLNADVLTRATSIISGRVNVWADNRKHQEPSTL